MRLKAVRGAVCTENSKESIKKNVGILCRALFNKNEMQESAIVSILFTVTKDITALNPAAALRQELGCQSIPLFCSQEPECDGGLAHTIRILITWYTELESVSPVYLNGAEILRPDLSSK